MTLIVAIATPDSIWMLADRRISFPSAPPKDDGRKIMSLETKDGVALLGYAGLGLTRGGMEPSDWMSNVLRGRKLPLEQSLGVLTEALKRELPDHLARLRTVGGPEHHIVVPAFVDEQCRFYSIDLVMSPDRTKSWFRYTRHVKELDSGAYITLPVCVAGSGTSTVMADEPRLKTILRLVRAYDQGQLSHRAVADELARLNESVAAAMLDGSVGPRCIVAWRNRKAGRRQGGGGQQHYTGTGRDSTSPSLPTIAAGLDIRAIAEALRPHFEKSIEGWAAGGQIEPPDDEKIKDAVKDLPDGPDESLR